MLFSSSVQSSIRQIALFVISSRRRLDERQARALEVVPKVDVTS